MSGVEPLWERRQVEDIGISIEVYLPWPYGSRRGAEGGNIYQDIADTGGLVFLQYGDGARLENFVAMKSDLVTTASIINERLLVYCGQPARRLTLRSVRQSLGVYRQDPVDGLTHGVSSEERKIISTIGFYSRGSPVLFGYEISEEQLPSYQPVLERILNSARDST
jgi:hypothetical protein